MTENKTCLNCQKPIEGRVGKKYCDAYCKSNHFYEKNKTKDQSFFKSIDLQLKKNRRILKEYNKAGKATVREEILLAEGFNPKFFTHFWRNSEGKAYIFCYEYGFMKITENDKTKYSLVTWQNYMNR
jgi:hypothetical protein|tara:strand:- start:709 stop:1089 length:381 start_codon:yes stop_codon:yes gene_type:complete